MTRNNLNSKISNAEIKYYVSKSDLKKISVVFKNKVLN